MKKYFFIAATIFCFFALGTVTFAAIGNPPPTGSITLANPLSPCGDLTCLIGKVLLFLYNLAIPVTVIMVLIGGFQILTAGGDPAKFTTGRNTILYAAAGFAVVVLANSVISIIQSILR